MKFFAIAASALLLATTVASADPVADRQTLMKERGGTMRILVPTAQEKIPFDAAAVMEALETLQANAAKVSADLDVLWPEGSDTGKNDTNPAAWDDREAFKAAHDKFAADVDAAVAANPTDLLAFQAIFGTVAGNCGSCHKAFRL